MTTPGQADEYTPTEGEVRVGRVANREERCAGRQGREAEPLRRLVEHLLEEEDPRLQVALRRVRSGSPVAVVSSAVARPGATVGSLRVERPSPQSGGGLLGNLRRR